MGGAPVSGSLPLGSGFSGQWGARVCGGCVRCAGPPPPATGRRGPPAPWTHPGLVDLLATDAHAPIIGVLEPQTGGDPPWDRPRSPGRVDDPLAQGRIGAGLRILGRAKGARAAACAAARR